MRIGLLDDFERRPITDHGSAGASVTPVARNEQVKNQTCPTLVLSGPDINPNTVLPSATTAVANA